MFLYIAMTMRANGHPRRHYIQMFASSSVAKLGHCLSEIVTAWHPYFGEVLPYNTPRYQSAASSASKLLKVGKVRKALESLETQEATLMGSRREVKRGILAAIMMGEVQGARVADRIRAIIVDNRMTGDDRPIRVEGELTFQAMLDSLPREILPGDYAQV